MEFDAVIVPQPQGAGSFIELSRTPQGRLFKKHILNKGPLYHPETGKVIDIDDSFVSTLQSNFKKGICDIVQIPLADSQNRHSEDPTRNLGEVVDIKVEGDKIFAMMDIRDPGAAPKMGKTYLGTSAFMSLNYKDTRTNQKVGPTLLHACVTNRPYVTGLDDYTEVVAATAADSNGEVVLLSQREGDAGMDLEEMIAALKDEHGIDVADLQRKADAGAAGEGTAQLTAALRDAMKAVNPDNVSLSQKEELTPADIVGAVVELSQQNVSLTSQVTTLMRNGAATEVDAMVQEGRILPKQRDSFLELKLSRPEMYESLLPEKPVVALNNQTGVTPPRDEKITENVDEELARLSNTYPHLFDKDAKTQG